MPMRQPCGSSAPACSPATSNGVAPSASTSLPLARKRTRPPSPSRSAAARPGRKRSTCSCSETPARAKRVGQRVQQAGRAARPGLALAPVGHAAVELGDGPSEPCAIVVVLVQRVAGRAPRASARSSPPKIASSARRGDVHVRDVGEAPPARCASARSIPMIGVMPLPAVTNSSACSSASGRTNSPGRRARAGRPCPARVADEVVGHQPPGIRLTVIAMRPSRRPRHRRERVGAPVPHAVDVDADADVLARQVRRPAATGPQPQRHAVARLGHHGFDPATRLARRPQRVELPEVVVRKKRCGEDCSCIEKADGLEDVHKSARPLPPR